MLVEYRYHWDRGWHTADSKLAFDEWMTVTEHCIVFKVFFLNIYYSFLYSFNISKLRLDKVKQADIVFLPIPPDGEYRQTKGHTVL